MEVRAITKYARMSCQKGHDVARKIQGMPAVRALEILQFTPKKSARLLEKTLRSAVANADQSTRQQGGKFDSTLWNVKEAQFSRGPQSNRFKAGARGSAKPRIRRSCHVRVVLSDGVKGK